MVTHFMGVPTVSAHDQEPHDGPASEAPAALTPDALRWRCDPARISLPSLAGAKPLAGIVGQETAVEALTFGLECRAPGQNIFVRGLTGTGRVSLVHRLLEQLQPRCEGSRDRCYVHNFEQPDRPRLISVPIGQGREFRRLVEELADFVRDKLPSALSGEALAARRAALDRSFESRMKELAAPFEEAARKEDFTLVSVQIGPASHLALFPVISGQGVPPEEFDRLRAEGGITEEQVADIVKRREQFEEPLRDLKRRIHDLQQQHFEGMRSMLEKETRALLNGFVERIASQFRLPAVREYLDLLVEDVVERLPEFGAAAAAREDFTRVYRVNVLLPHEEGKHCPIVVENVPTMMNLLGGVDRVVTMPGTFQSDHLMICAGSLLRADGGYLILEARDVLSEPGAWKVLVRTLRSGQLEIVPPELTFPMLGHTLKPEPIDVNVKVVLIGDAAMFYTLDELDPDFRDLFKLLADFNTEIPRSEEGLGHYARVVEDIARKEKLRPFDASAIAALAEHGARIASRRGKLTARFGRLADIAREAAYVAEKAGQETVEGEHVREAVRRTKRRSDLPSRRFRELMTDGTIRVQTRGEEVGQINGLAVQQAGSLTAGFPARITATIGPGTAGVINIEREAALSGAIHTKGFYILGGLLRHLLRADHPLAFDASIAFEQSYGGIDGDSASGAEICCLLSALTGVPIRQGLAMTGAIDQMGHIMAIGGANEKIEGFFDVCRDVGLTGDQGVIIPLANAGDLMLRTDVVDACAEGQFHVYAVDTVHEALALLTGKPAGALDPSGAYARGTVLRSAVDRAREYWERAARRTACPDGAKEE